MLGNAWKLTVEVLGKVFTRFLDLNFLEEHQCEQVLPLLEKDPCVKGHEQRNTFVTKLLPWDLLKWKAKLRRRPVKCILDLKIEEILNSNPDSLFWGASLTMVF